MSDEHRLWFVYADENLAVARLALEGGYYNACLQNVQQAVEKYLKATLLSRSAIFQKTHNIETLNRQLEETGLDAGLSEEDCELLDSIYIPWVAFSRTLTLTKESGHSVSKWQNTCGVPSYPPYSLFSFSPLIL